jgi:hypothetical protein
MFSIFKYSQRRLPCALVLSAFSVTCVAAVPAIETGQNDGATDSRPSTAPIVHGDASIQWEDLHYQAKPDGNTMYLVSTKGVLIEGSSFAIKAPDGSQHSNLLPWEVRYQVDADALVFNEPIKIKGAAGHLKVATTITGERALSFDLDFTATGYSAVRETLNLPLSFYGEQAFEVDGERFDYSVLQQHRSVLLKRRPFQSFSSLSDSGDGFVLLTQSELEIEVLNTLDWKGHRSIWVNLYAVDGQRIVYDLQLPAAHANASSEDSGSVAQNILINSSLELGREEWGVIFSKTDVSSRWELTEDTASHGQQSLKVSLVPQSTAFEPVAKHATIASDYFKANALDRLTVSADMKASVPGQKVKLQVRYVPTALVPNRGSNLIEKTVTLTQDWERYSFDVRLPLAAKNAYAIAVAIPATPDAVEVYLDAVAVTPQGDADYKPQQVIEANSDTVRYHRVYEPGEAFDVVTVIRNNSGATISTSARISILDTHGNVVFESEQNVDAIAAQSNARIAWEMPGFKLQGMYRVKVSVGEDSHSISLGVVRARKSNQVDPTIRFGTNISDLREFWAMERIGLGWSRFAFGCSLGSLMHKKGIWNERQAAKLDAVLDYQASFGVTPLAVIGPGMPKWASRAPAGSSASRAYTHRDDVQADFDDYLNRLIDLADGRLHAIETWNEPDIPLFYRGTVKEMADFTTRAYELIKAKDPSIEVVGLGLATPAETYNHFLKELLGHTGLAPFDAISYHPYTEGRRHPARGDFREVVQGFDEAVSEFGEVPLFWATEFGYFSLAEDAKPFVPYKNPFVAREILNEEECASAYIQAVSTAFAHGVDKFFYFILLEGDLLDRWLQGWVGPGGRTIESGFIAAAAACDIMYDVECDGQDDLGDGCWQTRFNGPDFDFVVLWSESGEQTRELQTDSTVAGRDLYGNSFELTPENGAVRIPFTETPIYLILKDLR